MNWGQKIRCSSWCKILSVLCILAGFLVFAAPIASAAAGDETKITAMTRNLYLGADIFRVVEAALNPNPNPDGLDVPRAVATVYQTMLYTNFGARAKAIADEIALNKPQVIGLQEVSTFYKQTPSDFQIGNPVKASTVVINFFDVLDAELKARGMYYQAFKVTNADVELPMLDTSSPTYLSDVRMVDHDYILVRKGTAAAQVLEKNYSTNVGLQLGAVYVEFTRGCLAVDVTVKGDAYRFVSTHLEVRSSVGSVYRFVQSAQMNELLDDLDDLSLEKGPKPLIMVGDFNSSPDDVPGYYQHPIYGPLPYYPPYLQAVNAGYLDSWLLQSRYDEGYTSGFDEYVSDPTAVLDSRIDLIFLDPYALDLDKVSCDIVGDEVSDMIPNPGHSGQYLWPSDHAGVVSKIKFLP